MKDVLMINQFSTMIDLPEKRQAIYVPAPDADTKNSYNFMTSMERKEFDEVEMSHGGSPLLKKWKFEYSHQLDKDIYLYKYTGTE